jgi:hypothetical protein
MPDSFKSVNFGDLHRVIYKPSVMTVQNFRALLFAKADPLITLRLVEFDFEAVFSFYVD